MSPSLPKQLAKHIRGVYFGGNWTSVNLTDTLADVSWQQASQKIGDLNTIVALAHHINYYVAGVSQVLEGGSLDIRDKYSFAHPTIESAEDWNVFRAKLRMDGERFAALIEQLPAENVWANMADPKYGNWFANLQGITEHCHYHLGQIRILKKLLDSGAFNNQPTFG